MKTQKKWQSRIHMNMNGIMIGSGWYEIEFEDNVYYRWSGPDQVSFIHINLCRDDEYRLNLAIHAAASENLLKNLEIKIDGQPLTITIGKSRSPTYITTIVPADRNKKKNKDSVLSFYFSKPLNSYSEIKSSTDKRIVGIAVQSIDIFPLSRPIFISQKYDDPEPFDGHVYLQNNPGVKDAVIQGQYVSAYEYFLKHRDINHNGQYMLDESFDERPGDIYDILKQDMMDGFEQLKNEYKDELKRLRNIVNRQGDIIRALKKELYCKSDNHIIRK